MRKRLDEIADVTKLAGFEFTKYMEYVDDGEIIAIRALNLKEGRLVLDDVKRITKNVSEKLPRSQLHKYDIVLSYTGTIGEAAQIMEEGKYHLAPNVAKVVPKCDVVDPRYLFHYICSREFKQQMKNYAHGSTQPTVPMATIRELTVPVYDYETEKKIANILTSISDKIEKNMEVNENLADQIQAIYSNEFEPTTHTPSGVLADICSYSADKIPVSELSVSTYFSTENMQPNKMGSVDATSLPSIVQTTRCHKGDVLISNIRPYFKKIVYVTDDSCGCSTDVLCFVPKEDQYSAFLFGTLYMDRFFDYMVAGSKGTKMPRGDKQQIMNYPVVLPDKESLDLFNGLIAPMLDQIATKRTESNRLAALRDALLPKLMSGELDVSALNL